MHSRSSNWDSDNGDGVVDDYSSYGIDSGNNVAMVMMAIAVMNMMIAMYSFSW